MDENRKHQVSLRGASAKEITRDALLQKVSHERELRNYTRRATTAAVFIQRVWRRYIVTKMVAMQLQEEWENSVNCPVDLMITRSWISSSLLRPFLFFITHLSTRHQKIQTRNRDCMQSCFKILLESINSTDSKKNFCSLATSSHEDRKIWVFQSQKLISLCSFILAQCDYSDVTNQDLIILTSLAMRLAVVLTDPTGWKSVDNKNRQDANLAVADLIQFIGSSRSGLYGHIRSYIIRLTGPSDSFLVNSDEKFLITASAITLALRPFHNGKVRWPYAAEQYCVFLLTIPWLTQRLPPVLLPALKHKSVLSPCFSTILISTEKIVAEMGKLDKPNIPYSMIMMPQVGWALANIISLVLDNVNCSLTQGLDYDSYVRVVVALSEKLLAWLENVGSDESPVESIDMVMHEPTLKISYIDLYRPVCHQCHLMKLLAILKGECSGKLELPDVAFFYSSMLRIFSALNPNVGSLPVLNTLSFTPGFLVNLWEALERSFFPESNPIPENNRNKLDEDFEKKKKRPTIDGGKRWVAVLHKFTGKSPAEVDCTDLITDDLKAISVHDDFSDVWDIVSLKQGPQGISKETSCVLHLFCATYSHLLLVLDDIEFYEKQVPFTLEQQRRIASMLNTLVYNGLFHSNSRKNKTLLDASVRCLHLLYERDCRHQFCPSSLWLSPAKQNRPPVATAARAHEVYSANLRPEDPLTGQSVITTMPHVFPFEERVQMFREFVKMDKVSRRVAGEVTGPGPGSVEIVVRRGHIVEDGFQQLNSLGSRLKSSIHVSFVSECGLPEAGLDYGGLSKEFLTDISKAAFAPEYGLFSQTSTSEGLLIPNTAARYLENGIQMIEFLGKIVGKALYEGILLDYSFSHVFVQKLLGRYSFLDELSTLDPELYRNLMYVKHYGGDVKELSLDFTITEESFGKMHVIELKPGGKDVSVTNENKLQYVHAIADFKLNRQILPLSNAFYRGLTDLILPSWLKLFNASEFNQLLSGGKHDIDVDDLRNNTRYTGGYSEGSRTVRLFWEVIAGFEPKERCMVLKFVTSCSRAPLLGFKYLQPAFTIHKVACDVPLWASIGGQDVERLPSASTCYNTLKLPTYKRSSTLRAKLLYAVNSNAGFELS